MSGPPPEPQLRSPGRPPTRQEQPERVISIGPVEVLQQAAGDVDRQTQRLQWWSGVVGGVVQAVAAESPTVGRQLAAATPVLAVGAEALARVRIRVGSEPAPAVQVFRWVGGHWEPSQGTEEQQEQPLRYYGSVPEVQESLREQQEMFMIGIRARDPTLMPTMPTVDEERLRNLQLQCDMARGLVMSWVSTALPEQFAGVLREWSPLFIVGPPGYLEAGAIYHANYQPLQEGEEIVAAFVSGTNVIVVNPADERIQVGSTVTLHILVHETLHYLAYMASCGTMIINTRSGDASTLEADGTVEFADAMTEYLARYISSPNGCEPLPELYCTGVSNIALIRYLLDYTPPGQHHEYEQNGMEVLIRAYSTGDYREVQRRVDAVLGEGTFEQIIQSSSSRAFQILTGRMRSSHIEPREVRDQIGDPALTLLWARIDARQRRPTE
jgi:hypothetical protein